MKIHGQSEKKCCFFFIIVQSEKFSTNLVDDMVDGFAIVDCKSSQTYLLILCDSLMYYFKILIFITVTISYST